MDCLRFGFDFHFINHKAATVSRKVLGIPKSHRRRRHYKIRRVKTPPSPKPPPIPLKIYNPPTFSIELHNIFEILDI